MRGDDVLYLYLVHVANNPGNVQLLAGDVAVLRKMLPESNVVRLFQVDRDANRPTRLNVEDAARLLGQLRGLRKLEESELNRRYPRSSVHPEMVTTIGDLVEALIRFLVLEIRTIVRR